MKAVVKNLNFFLNSLFREHIFSKLIPVVSVFYCFLLLYSPGYSRSCLEQRGVIYSRSHIPHRLWRTSTTMASRLYPVKQAVFLINSSDTQQTETGTFIYCLLLPSTSRREQPRSKLAAFPIGSIFPEMSHTENDRTWLSRVLARTASKQ